MAIQLGQQSTTGAPVMKRQQIGESFQGVIIDFDTRDQMKDKAPVLKDNGQHKQEMVVHLFVLQGDMRAGIGGHDAVPAPGSVVRLIMASGDFGQWIEAVNAKAGPVNVGDLVWRTTTHATEYTFSGVAQDIATLKSAAEVDAFYADRNRFAYHKLGFRGDMTISEPPPEYLSWVQAAEAEYMRMHATPVETAPAPAPAPAAPPAAAPPVTPAPAVPAAPAPVAAAVPATAPPIQAAPPPAAPPAQAAPPAAAPPAAVPAPAQQAAPPIQAPPAAPIQAPPVMQPPPAVNPAPPTDNIFNH